MKIPRYIVIKLEMVDKDTVKATEITDRCEVYEYEADEDEPQVVDWGKRKPCTLELFDDDGNYIEPKDEPNSSEKPNNCKPHIVGKHADVIIIDEPQREYPTEWCEKCELWREDNCIGVAQCKRNIQILTEAYKAEQTEPQTERSEQ